MLQAGLKTLTCLVRNTRARGPPQMLQPTLQETLQRIQGQDYSFPTIANVKIIVTYPIQGQGYSNLPQPGLRL